MISAWNLLWILPLMSIITLAAIAFVSICGDEEEPKPTESPHPPPMDEDMNRHSGLLEDE